VAQQKGEVDERTGGERLGLDEASAEGEVRPVHTTSKMKAEGEQANGNEQQTHRPNADSLFDQHHQEFPTRVRIEFAGAAAATTELEGELDQAQGTRR
jgi:hypothetical protein